MINMIACIGKNNGLGYKGGLLFHLPEDMRFFKEKTMGSVVVMGRKTYESLGRPLDGRRNVVMTRGELEAQGVEVVHNMNEFWDLYKSIPAGQNVFIIGGAEIYKQFIDEAANIYLTEVDLLRPADAFFPAFDKQDFRERVESRGQNYRIMRYTRYSTL